MNGFCTAASPVRTVFAPSLHRLCTEKSAVRTVKEAVRTVFMRTGELCECLFTNKNFQFIDARTAETANYRPDGPKVNTRPKKKKAARKSNDKD